MDLSTITIADFKAFFTRDFPYTPAGTDDNEYVTDADITKAFGEAQILYNQDLFGNDASIRTTYLYLTAHFLTLDIRGGLTGISGGAIYPVSGKTVGSVSESYAIPEDYLKDPYLSTYTQTSYGLKYLGFLLPNLVGNMNAVFGGTNP